jgi:O-antigen/teichoic acid export membrane protein
MNNLRVKPKSTSSNYIISLLSTIIFFLFSLILLSHVYKILGPEVIGKINFVNSFISYFILFSSFGIPVYGIKLISKKKNNFSTLNKAFSELFFIGFFLSIVSIFLFFIFINVFKVSGDYFLVSIIFSLTVMFNFLSIDWFFVGLEDYYFVSIRNIVVKIVAGVALFLFVNSPNDYLIYIIIIVTTTLLTNLINFFYAIKIIKFQFINLDFFIHFKPLFFLFLANLVGSVYINLDSILLSLLSGNIHLGYFSTNKKIIAIALLLIGTLGTILTPKLSYYVERNLMANYHQLLTKSINFIYLLSFPAISFLLLMSNNVLSIVAGNSFLPGSLSLAILSFQILFSSLSALFGFQVILAFNNEKSIFISNIVGSISNLVINLLLIKVFNELATSFAIVVSELSVLLTQLYLSKKYVHIKLLTNNVFNYLLSSLIYIISIIFLKESNLFIEPYKTVLIFSSAGIIYIITLLLLKDRLTIEMINILLKIWLRYKPKKKRVL